MATSSEPETPRAQAASFADLGLSHRVLPALADVGYEVPTPVQSATIPPLLAGCDLIGQAQTGTGKTAAFALPVLDRLDPRAKAPQALVLAPTRELALQVSEAFERYAARADGIRVLPVYGGQGYGVQLSALRRGVQVVVGTPGRVIDHLERGTLDLSALRFLVLDEADEMLSMGFADDLETIVAATPADKQVALFSATMPKAVRALAKKSLRDPVEISMGGRAATAEGIRQRYLIVSYPQKLDLLTRILEVENFAAMIVFVRTKTETETLAERLRARGYSAQAINGDVPQVQRERVVQQLRDGTLDILVATDVAARGLDVERISHVINYDIPTDPESYVHRIGRTGRAGRSGEAISFVTPRERYLLRQIEKATGRRLDEMPPPSVDEVNTSRLARFDDRITAALGSDQVPTLRDVVAHYVREHDVPELDVAAALAVALHGDTSLLLDPEAPAPRPTGERRPPADRPGRRRQDTPMATYRIAVGRRQKVEPRQVVGALANEGGLRRGDFGKIQIRADHSLVELPAELPKHARKALRRTMINGVPIDLQRER